MKLILVGQQGAGKGTVATIVKEKLNIPHISTGDIFRAAIKEGSDLGKLAGQYIHDGNLVPDEVTIDTVKKRLQEDDCKNGYILDGFPRNLDQVNVLESWGGIDRVILLNIDDDLTVYRLAGRRVCKGCSATYSINPDGFPRPKVDGKCNTCAGEIYQRKDDTEAAIRERLKIYHEETSPILAFYAQKGVVEKINAANKIDEIINDVMASLE